MHCPNCGGNVSIYFVDGDECDGEYRNYFEGTCYQCDKSFEWADVYQYTYTTEAHEIDENDHL